MGAAFFLIHLAVVAGFVAYPYAKKSEQPKASFPQQYEGNSQKYMTGSNRILIEKK